MKKTFISLLIVPFLLVGCSKNKDIYSSSKNTYYKYRLEEDEVYITGFNDKYKGQSDIIIPYSIDKKVVVGIDKKSFDNNYRLKKVDMSKSNVKEIGEYAFKDCDALEEVLYSKTVTNIEQFAFYGCNVLQSMDFSECQFERVNDDLFYNCKSLTSVTFPSTTKVIGSKIFEGCSNITEIDLSNLTNLEELSDYSFYGLQGLQKVTVPKSLKKIGSYAFADDKNLKSLNFSECNIEEIGECAFSNCRAMKSITLPNTLNSLGDKCFYYCSAITELDLSKTNLTVLPKSCFELCIALRKVKLPAIETISNRAFDNSGITSIVIPKETKNIANDAFRICKSLATIEVNAENKSFIIQNGALYSYDLSRLLLYPAAKEGTSFAVSDKTSSIDIYAFSEANKLTQVDLSAAINVTVIDSYTFMNCTMLEKVILGGDASHGVKKIESMAFFGCNKLDTFTGNRALQEIGESAFYDCDGLTNVLLIDSDLLTSIGSNAFRNCKTLQKLTIPGSLKTIGNAALLECNNLTTIIYGGTEQTLRLLIDSNLGSCLEDYESIIQLSAYMD